MKGGQILGSTKNAAQRLADLCSIPFGEAQQALRAESVRGRAYMDVQCPFVSCQLRSDHVRDSLQHRAQILGMHLQQLGGDRDIEQPVPGFLRFRYPMRNQTRTEDPRQAYDRPAFASRAFAAGTVADHFAIEAEDRIPKRQNTCFR